MVTTEELARLRAKAQKERSLDERRKEANQLTREIRERNFDRTRTGRLLKGVKGFGRATGRGLRATGSALDKAEARRKSTPQSKKRKPLNFNDMNLF